MGLAKPKQHHPRLRRQNDATISVREQVLADFGETLVDAIGATVDRIEERAAAQVPELAHMDLEAD